MGGRLTYHDLPVSVVRAAYARHIDGESVRRLATELRISASGLRAAWRSLGMWRRGRRRRPLREQVLAHLQAGPRTVDALARLLDRRVPDVASAVWRLRTRGLVVPAGDARTADGRIVQTWAIYRGDGRVTDPPLPRERRLRVMLRTLDAEGQATAISIAERTAYHTDTVRHYLYALERDGLATTVGAVGRRHLWTLTDAGRAWLAGGP